MILETDKSGRFAVMPMEVYLRAGDEHVVDNGLQYLTQRAIKAKVTDKLSVSLHRMCQV